MLYYSGFARYELGMRARALLVAVPLFFVTQVRAHYEDDCSNGLTLKQHLITLVYKRIQPDLLVDRNPDTGIVPKQRVLIRLRNGEKARGIYQGSINETLYIKDWDLEREFGEFNGYAQVQLDDIATIEVSSGFDVNQYSGTDGLFGVRPGEKVRLIHFVFVDGQGWSHEKIEGIAVSETADDVVLKVTRVSSISGNTLSAREYESAFPAFYQTGKVAKFAKGYFRNLSELDSPDGMPEMMEFERTLSLLPPGSGTSGDRSGLWQRLRDLFRR